jgi:8-oxo-dGTP diphosphatase
MADLVYPRPMLTVDVVVLADPDCDAAASASAADTGAPHVLLIERGREPFAGRWALPGGFVEDREPVGHAAARELAEETGLRVPILTLLGVYDTPGRDPRGWTVSVVYLARVSVPADVVGADDAQDACWFAASALPPLAFDHDLIVADALRRAAPIR